MISTKKCSIELSIDTEDADAFAAWLRDRGHAVRIGRSTGSYIDGAWTSSDCEANKIMRALWESFCSDQCLAQDQPATQDNDDESLAKRVLVAATFACATLSIIGMGRLFLVAFGLSA